MRSDLLKVAGLVLVLAVASGCAASRAFSRAERAARAGDWDAAVNYYNLAAQKDPQSAEYKIALERAQLTASRGHLETAKQLEEKGDLDGAVREYRKAAEFDTSNRHAAAKAAELEQKVRDKIEAARPKPQYEQLKERAKQTSPEPALNPASKQPLKFTFAQGVQQKQILDFIGQSSGINVMYEDTFKDNPTKSSTDLDGVTLEQALNLVLSTNNLFYKILNPKTILIIPDTQQNRNKYEDTVIQTFYLSHGDATEILGILNAVLAGQQGQNQNRPLMQINKSLNAINVRGTAAAVSMAGQLIDRNDKARAEIVVDVEILEVNRTRVKQYGLNLSNYQIGMQFSPEAPPSGTTTSSSTTGAASTSTSSGTFNLNSVVHGINTTDFYLAIPSAVVKFLESDSQTKLIAKPSLRGAEGKKLSAHLGDDIPVPSTTFQPLVGGGSAINPMTSFNYRQVGVNVDVTPRVTFDGDVLLELEVESSTKGSDVNVAGQNLPSFGSRKVTSTMRLRDGESNLIAGLLRDDERKSLAGVPGGIHLPLVKQLFSANESQVSQTDIVMLLTPHIIRTQGLTEKDLQPIYIGTMQNPSLTGNAPAIGAVPEPVAATQPVATQPAAPISTLPYGAPGSAPVGGAPVGRPTAQGTPVIPPGSSPIPGTVMVPPQQPAPQAAQPQSPPAQAQPVQAQPVATPPAAAAQAPTPAPAGAQVPPASAPVTPTTAAGRGATTAASGAKPAAATTAGGATATAAPSGTAQVLLSPPSAEFKVGQGPYPVAISISNISRVTTLSLTMTYNPAVVKIRSIQEGSFMRQGVPNAAFAHQEDNAAGRVDITISRAGDTVGATGSGTIAAVVFEAAAAGQANFKLTGVANGPGGPIKLEFSPAAVTVK